VSDKIRGAAGIGQDARLTVYVALLDPSFSDQGAVYAAV